MALAHGTRRSRDLRAVLQDVRLLEERERWDEIDDVVAETVTAGVPGSERDRVMLMIAWARASAKRGVLAEAWQRLRDLRPALGALRDDDLAAEWHCAMSAIRFRQGDMQGAATEADDCLRLAQGGRRSAYLRGVACQTLALVAQHAGDWPAARRLLRRAIDTFGECGAETRETRAQMNLCSVLVWAGEWDEFESAARDVLAAAQRLQASRLMKQVLLLAAMVARGRGQCDRAHDYLDRVRRIRPSEQDPRESALAREIEGDLLLEGGDAPGAFEAYDDVVRQGQALALGRDIVFEGLRKRAEAAFALGDLELAARDAQQAVDEARAQECVVEVGAGLRVLAQVAQATGAIEQARRLAEEAVFVLTRVRERYQRARTLLALAELLPDPAAARAEAAALARLLGARPLLAELQSTRPVAGSEPRRVVPLAADAPLTLAPVAIQGSSVVGKGSGSAGMLSAPARSIVDLAPLAFHLGDACVLGDMARVLAHGGDALLEGEPGTETREVAAELHRRSGRRGRCLGVDAAQVSAEQIAAVLFGEAARGGRPLSPGALERAAGGTVVLHNVTALPALVQGALAHALQSRTLPPPAGDGGPRPLTATVYLTAPMRMPLALAEARLTRDLAASVQFNRLHVPALRHRPADLAAALDRLWRAAQQRHGKAVTLSAPARAALLHALWDGNVPEMETAIEALVRVAPPGHTVTVTDLDARHAACALGRPPSGLAQQEHEFLVERVLSYLRAASGNYAKAARLAGYTRSGFLKLVVRLGLKQEAPTPADRPDEESTPREDAPAAEDDAPPGPSPPLHFAAM